MLTLLYSYVGMKVALHLKSLCELKVGKKNGTLGAKLIKRVSSIF